MTAIGETLVLNDGEYEVVDRVPQYVERADENGKVKVEVRSYALIVERNEPT